MTSRLDGFRNGSKTGRIALAQSIQLLALSAIPALASDGVLEINQTCAVQTGCFAGDTATYPVTISASGSYQLTSNLIIPSLNTTGILISASDVEIDLNGFSIIGAACVGATTNCTPTALALGIGIDQSPNSLFGMSVRNGSIMGMGWYGLSAGNQATIDGVRTRWNRSTGIIALEGATVLKSVAYQNGGSGITTGVGSTLSNNTSNGNGGIGISCNFGSTATGNTAFDNSGTGLASFGKSTLSRNTARRNGGTGISAGNGSTVSGNTVSESGSDGIVVGRDSMVLGNSATFNTGFGLNIGDGSGYRENMVAGLSAAGTVTGTGLNLGANVCNSVVCP